MSKIVIPVKDDFLSESFTACSYFLIYEVKEGKVVSKKIDFYPDELRQGIDHWSEGAGITDVIVHWIDKGSLAELSSSKINLFVGVKVSTPDRLIEDFLNGTLRSDTHYMVEKCGTL
jgi:predicted Fe-Mo cluster-binding NifX family protein